LAKKKDPPRLVGAIKILNSINWTLWFVIIRNLFPKVTDPDARSEEAQMANEYEKLSQMCLKQNKYMTNIFMFITF
jgi:hypothetical protein